MAEPEVSRPSPGRTARVEPARYFEVPAWLAVGLIGGFAFGVAFVALGVFDLYAVAGMMSFLTLCALAGLMLRRDDGRNAVAVAGWRLLEGMIVAAPDAVELAAGRTARAAHAAAIAVRSAGGQAASTVRGLARNTTALRDSTAHQWRGAGPRPGGTAQPGGRHAA
jgi:hypothetical protein